MNINCKPLLARVLSLVLLFSNIPARAHGSHGHHHHGHSPKIEITEVPADGLTTEQYRALLDDAHHSIENESEGTRWQRFKQKLQFKKIALNAYRWYSSHRGIPYVDNTAANIAGLLLTSHALETVGGFAMGSTGVAGGLNSATEWVMTVVGFTIPIPGLDPLCIILGGVYKKFPQTMDKVLTIPRIFVVRGLKTANGFAGVPDDYWASLYSQVLKQKFLRDFQQNNSTLGVRPIMMRDFEFRVYGPGEDQFIDLQFNRRDNGEMSLHSVRFSRNAPAVVRTYMAQLLRPFGMNIRALVLEIDKAINNHKFNELKHLQYIEQVDELPWRHTVVVKPGAFPFHDLHESEFLCESLLQ